MHCQMRTNSKVGLAIAGWLLISTVAYQAHGLPDLDQETTGRLAEIEHLIEKARYREADSLATALLTEVEEAYGPVSLEAAHVLDLIVKARRRGGKAKGSESIRFAQRAVDIREDLLGPEHPEVAVGLLNLGYILGTTGNYHAQIEVLDRAAEILENAPGPVHPDMGKIMTLRGRALSELGQDSEARASFERGLEIQEKTLGEDHPDVAETLQQFSWYWYYARDYQKAIAMNERALEIQQATSPRNDHDIVRTLNALACAVSKGGERDRAWDLFHQALEISREALEPDCPEVGYIHYNLGEMKWEDGELDAGRAYFKQGLSILEKAYGPEHEDVAYGLVYQGVIDRDRGDYASARSLIERAIAIDERTLGADNPRVARKLQTLAFVLTGMGEYVEARRAIERAISIGVEAQGEHSPDAISGRRVLANLMCSLGNYSEARAGLEEALAGYEKVLGPNHPGTGYVHSDLGWVLYRMNDLDMARQAFERALAIHEQALGPDHSAVAGDLLSLGIVLGRTGDYDTAAAFHERALAIMEEREDGAGPGTARCLYSLAILRRDAGDPDGAKALYDRALPMAEDVLGLDHPNRARVLYNYAVLLSGTGQHAEALEAALEAERISREHVRLTSRRFAEEEGLRYAAVRISGLDLALSLAAELNDPDATRKAWDALIRSRALVLDEIAARHRTVTDISRLAEDLVLASERLAKLMVRGAEGDSPERYNRMLEEAQSQKDRAERALAERSAGFRDDQRRSRTTLWDAVADLDRQSALVSFVRYERHETDASLAHTPGPRPIVTPSYLALIQRRDEPEPIVIDLGSADDIEGLISEWRREFEPGQVRVEPAYQMIGDALRRMVWDPVAAHLDRIEQVLIVPDGALNLVSFAALPAEPDGYVLDEGPIIHYVSAERDLVPSETPPIEGQGLLALGGPDYGADIEVAALGTATSFRGERSACADFAELRFAPLTGAATETDEIASLWSDTFGAREVVHLSGSEAGEAALKARASGKRVLHLATHGFFMGNCASALTADPEYEGMLAGQYQAPPVHGENPLVLAGLALAGANRRALAGPDVEDGILTAQEIGALDLSSVEVAVLSACDTGVGEIRAGEGVFGLRRAFHVAGARTLVMSLWPVDDESTREWMRAFYEKWLTDGLSKAEALRGASLAVLQARRDQGESEHPFYWGAFVAAGDWR